MRRSRQRKPAPSNVYLLAAGGFVVGITVLCHCACGAKGSLNARTRKRARHERRQASTGVPGRDLDSPRKRTGPPSKGTQRALGGPACTLPARYAGCTDSFSTLLFVNMCVLRRCAFRFDVASCATYTRAGSDSASRAQRYTYLDKLTMMWHTDKKTYVADT